MLNILERLTAAINGSGANISTDELALLVEQAGLRPGSSKQVQGMPEGMALLHSSIPELDEPKIVFFWAGEPVQWTQNAKVRFVGALMVPEGVRDLRIYSRLAKAILRLGESDEFKSASGPSEAVRKAVAIKLGEIIHALEDEAKGANR